MGDAGRNWKSAAFVIGAVSALAAIAAVWVSAVEAELEGV